ncbi:hypothetical protein [Shewanella glacialipiscicola]|uniref:hypothetical protein n=1 Tax=Shewanella glacialipiscicola TaxID=614069 RepID=UPI003D791390
MRNPSIASVIEKNKISSDNALTFAIDLQIYDIQRDEFVETIRLVNYVNNLQIDGQQYIRFPFSFDLQEDAGEIKNVTLSLQDQAGIILPYLIRFRGAVGSQVNARLITVMPDNSTAVVDFAESFTVLSSSSANYVTSLELGSENPLSRSCPARTQMKDRCSFRFKSIECGYEGSLESCDLTLTGKNGCRAHNNSKRYGGYPSIALARL